jgi:hypothetical protein
MRRLERLRRRAVVAKRGTLALPLVHEGLEPGGAEARAALVVSFQIEHVVEHDGEERRAAIQAVAAEHGPRLQPAEAAQELGDMGDERGAHGARA